MITGKPYSIQVLACFACSACGEPMQRLSIAPLLPDGRVDMNHRGECLGTAICNACIAKDQEQVKRANREHQARKRWANKTPKLTG